MFGWDWMLIWTALEAIAVAVGVVAIFWQVKRMREESVQHKFEGFELAAKLLSSEHLVDFFERPRLTPAWGAMRGLMDLEVVGELIDKDYVDRDLVYRFRGRYLAVVYSWLRSVDAGKHAGLKNLTPRAYKLVHDAWLWWSEVHERLDLEDIEDDR